MMFGHPLVLRFESVRYSLSVSSACSAALEYQTSLRATWLSVPPKGDTPLSEPQQRQLAQEAISLT